MLDQILLNILYVALIVEAILLITGQKTISNGMGFINFEFPKWCIITTIISIGVLDYFLFVKWNVKIHPFLIAIYHLIFGHIFGRF